MNLKQRTAVFKALGHPARLKITDALSVGERCVQDLVKLTGLGWSTVSRHLSVLRNAGIVSDDKRGQQVFYRIELPCIAQLNACLDGPAAARKGAACCAKPRKKG